MVRLQPGGIIGCTGFDLQSNVINVFTLGLPGVSIHHVGVVSEYDGEPLIYESTKGERPACVRTGRTVAGVQAHTLDQFRRIPFYSHLWYYPPRRELYLHEKERLRDYLESVLRTPYDTEGALRSGGCLFSAASALLCGENLASLFCSELCMESLVQTGIVQTRDASRWSPNYLVRHLIRNGVCGSPIDIKLAA